MIFLFRQAYLSIEIFGRERPDRQFESSEDLSTSERTPFEEATIKVM